MEIRFSNYNLSLEKSQAAKSALLEWFKEAREPMDGEIKKPEELDLVVKGNIALRQYFELLGIGSSFREIDPNSVHFISTQEYEKLGFKRGQAKSSPGYDTIFINRDATNVNNLVFTYLHEAVHAVSDTVFEVNGSKISVKKTGFDIVTNSPTAKEVFVGLNEAVIDYTARIIQDNNLELFFGEGSEINKRIVGAYPDELSIFDEIISGISRKKDAELRDIWFTFSRALFTGETAPLKLIEETFGKGSLKILATLGHERLDVNLSEEERHDYRKNILKYFQERSPK
jgi:hypothetical protein